MNLMDNSYGVGIANRFMLLDEETDDTENGSFDEAPDFSKTISQKSTDTIKSPLAKLHIDREDNKIQNERSINRREDNKRYKVNEQPKEHINEAGTERRAKFNQHERNTAHDGPKSFTPRGGMGTRGRPFGNNRGGNRDRPRKDFEHGGERMDEQNMDKSNFVHDPLENSDAFKKSPIKKDIKCEEDNTNQEWNKEDLSEQFSHQPINNEAGAEDKKVEEAAEPEKEPEVVQLTLDEWKAMQENTIVKPEYKLRKPGEGEDASKWKGTYVLRKGDEEEEEEEYEEDIRHSGRTKKLLDIDITYRSPAARGRGGSGNRGAGFRMTRAFNSPAVPPQMRQSNGEFNNFRGGPRGRGGPGNFGNRRGGFQHPNAGDPPRRPPNANNNNQENAPTFNDEADFPSLRTIIAK